MSKDLWNACHSCDPAGVERGLAGGMSARFCDPSGITPLMIAIDSGVGDKELRLLAGASDLLAVDDEGEGAGHRAARRARAPLLEWLASEPALAMRRSLSGRLACEDAAFARWGEGVGALLGAQSTVNGVDCARAAAMACLASAVRAGVSVGDGIELEALRVVPLGADAALARAMRALWGGEPGERRHQARAVEEAAAFEGVLAALWGWMDARRWEGALGAYRPGNGSLQRSRKMDNAARAARGFCARQEARGLGEAAHAAEPASPEDRGRL